MARQTLYAELSDELIREIKSGHLPVGSMLPTEMDIAAQRNISRSTVRAALDRLVWLGLVTRQRGVGTRVNATEPSPYGASTGSLEELSHFGNATDRRIIAQSLFTADAEFSSRYGIAPGTRWMRMRGLRGEPGGYSLPLCLTDNFIDLQFEDIFKMIPDHQGLIADLIATEHGVTIDEVHQTLRPIALEPDIADLLGADPGAPALLIMRHYRSAGRMLYFSVSQHPGDRFEYKVNLRRQSV